MKMRFTLVLPALWVPNDVILRILDDQAAGLPSVFPAPSVARTEKVCEPSARALYPCGLVQLE